MTDRQENKLSMYLAVQKVCNAHKSVWSGLQAFVDACGEFESKIQDIQAARLVQEGKVTGPAKDKQKEEDEMIEFTVRVAGAVTAFASAEGNNTLKDKVAYSPSELRLSRDTILRDICQLIHDTANEYLTDLADYGIDATVLADLQKEITDFADILVKPRETITTRAEATSRLVELFAENDKILNERMDPLMEQFKDNTPFYKQYHGARIIVDLGVRHEAEPGEPQEPLA